MPTSSEWELSPNKGMPQAAVPLLIVSLAATAASAGMQYYGQQQQAAQQERMAQYNYEVQQQNIAVQQKMADYQRQVNESNAGTMRNYAAAQEAQGRQYAAAQEAQGLEQAKRTRMEKERLLAVQRGQFAASGVQVEGSPLAILSDTATTYELQANDAIYSANLGAMDTRYKANASAADSRYKASMMESNSAATFDLAGIQADLDSQRNNLTRMSNLNTAGGTRLASYGTLLNGVSQIGGTLATYKYPGKSVNATVSRATE